MALYSGFSRLNYRQDYRVNGLDPSTGHHPLVAPIDETSLIRFRNTDTRCD